MKSAHLSWAAAVILIQLSSCTKPEKVVEWKKFEDPKTGKEVWQITDHDSMSVAVYYERQAFTADDRYLCFGSNRSGIWQIYRSDLGTGEIVPLAPGKEVMPFSFTMHPDGRNLCYVHENILYKTDVSSLSEKVWMDLRGKFSTNIRFSNTFSLDARYTVVTTRTDSGTCIFRIDLETGKVEHALTWIGEGFSHPMILPANPDRITFVPLPNTQDDMTLPMEKRAKTWIVDIKTKKARQFLTVPYGFKATHLTWSSDGKRYFFFKKTSPGWLPVSICSVDQQGGDWREYYTHDSIRLGHGVSSSDGEWFLSDGQDPNNNPLILIHLKTGKDFFLCWPNASIDPKRGQYGHAHPALSRSGRFACYTSDASGTPQVFVVPVSAGLDE